MRNTWLNDESASAESEEDENGEPLLCAIEDEAELDTVYQLIMDQLYAEDSEDEE